MAALFAIAQPVVVAAELVAPVVMLPIAGVLLNFDSFVISNYHLWCKAKHYETSVYMASQLFAEMEMKHGHPLARQFYLSIKKKLLLSYYLRIKLIEFKV